jgi:hypothetical protein
VTRPLALLLILTAVSGSACVNARLVDGNSVAEDRLPQIRPGETTKRDVLDWFGAPESFTDPSAVRRLLEDSEVLPEDVLQLPFADVLVFELTRMRVRGLFLILYNHIDIRSASDRLIVFFDESDRVLYYGWRRGTDVLD